MLVLSCRLPYLVFQHFVNGFLVHLGFILAFLPAGFYWVDYQACFCFSGELADLLDMAPSDLALKIIPAAIPKLTEDKSKDGLEALAHSVGYGLQQMMLDYGHHVVAKYLYGGNARQ